MTKHCLFILLCAICSLSVSAQKRTMLSGKIISAEDKSIIDFATVYLKGVLPMDVPLMSGVFII